MDGVATQREWERVAAGDGSCARLIAQARRAIGGFVPVLEHLGAQLVRLADQDPEAEAELFGLLAADPALLLGLDRLARQGWTLTAPGDPDHRWFDQARDRFARCPAPAGPAVAALASLNADGRVRERAVAAMTELPTFADHAYAYMPFLVLRTTDWVTPVRDRARASLVLVLDRWPDLLFQAATTALRLAGRGRSAFALGQVRAALANAPDEVFTGFLKSADPRLRRLAAAVPGRIEAVDLALGAAFETDRAARLLFAEAAARDTVWTGRYFHIDIQFASRWPDSRVLAVTALIRAGLVMQAADHLADPSQEVRAAARDAARRSGIDAMKRYRELAAAPTVEPAALYGLAETAGRDPDGEVRGLIEPHLSDPRPRVRIAAVAALGMLGASDTDRLLSMLLDPVSRVVRAAAHRLGPDASRLDPGPLLALVADPDRTASARKAVYTLICKHGATARLGAMLTAVAGEDLELAERAAVHLHRTNVISILSKPPAVQASPHYANCLSEYKVDRTAVPDLPERFAAVRPRLDPRVAAAFDALIELKWR